MCNSFSPSPVKRQVEIPVVLPHSPERLSQQVCLVQTYYNFCLPCRSLVIAPVAGQAGQSRTPAAMAGVTDRAEPSARCYRLSPTFPSGHSKASIVAGPTPATFEACFGLPGWPNPLRLRPDWANLSAKTTACGGQKAVSSPMLAPKFLFFSRFSRNLPFLIFPQLLWTRPGRTLLQQLEQEGDHPLL